MRTDVVVCGAGVAGLAAAHALGALGLEVLLVDKQTTLTTAAKGEVLQPGALKILGWRAVISTQFDAGGSRYSLTFASPEPAVTPFRPSRGSLTKVMVGAVG